MQGSWGAKSIFTDMARQYVERVEAMSGGRLRIDYLPAGAVVKAFQVQAQGNRLRLTSAFDGKGFSSALWCDS